MISIITAVYNQLPINELFVQSLERYSRLPYELIIIDNGSTDGSIEFFEAKGAKVIRNEANYSYPHCQNQGIAAAQYDYFAFLNNDIIVAPGWDEDLVLAMQKHGLDLACPAAIERAETEIATKRLRRKWKWIKGLSRWMGSSKWALVLRYTLMYGDWELFCNRRRFRFGDKITEGFSGHSIITTRRAINLLGPWDERIQAADFDLYLRSKKRQQTHGDILPIHIVQGVFHHHFERLTVKASPPRFADADKLISLEDKWPLDEKNALIADALAYRTPKYKQKAASDRGSLETDEDDD